MEQLLDILLELRPDLDFEKEDKLIDNGILDSFDVISLVSEIDSVFNIKIRASELLPEHLNSMQAIWELIEQHLLQYQ